MIFNHERYEKHERIKPIEFDGFRMVKGAEFDPFGMGTKMNPQIAQMDADYIRVEFEAIRNVTGSSYSQIDMMDHEIHG